MGATSCQTQDTPFEVFVKQHWMPADPKSNEDKGRPAVVVESGFGDGRYPLIAYTIVDGNEEKLKAAYIVFLTAETERQTIKQLEEILASTNGNPFKCMDTGT